MKTRSPFCLTIVGLAIGALPAVAPAYTNPGVVAQGQVLRSMNEGYAERAMGRTAVRRSNVPIATSCRQRLPEFEKQYGVTHPQVMELQRLCRRAGY